MKVRFLHIDNSFIHYLKTIDNKVQNNYDGNTHKKPYISGILINVNGKDYVAPLTSPKAKYKHLENKVIFKLETTKINPSTKKKECTLLGVILLNNMIPYVPSTAKEIEFKDYDMKYQILLRKQYKIITSNWAQINHIANNIYHYVTVRKERFFTNLCCDFQKLENAINLNKFNGLNALHSSSELRTS